jgi:hypothetical protein
MSILDAYSWQPLKAEQYVVSGKWLGHSGQVREGPSQEQGGKPRYNVSWAGRQLESLFALLGGLGLDHCNCFPPHPPDSAENPLPVTQPPWEWLNPGATIKLASFSQNLVTS